MAGVIDSASLNHEEEAFVAVLGGVLESTKSSLCHFFQRRIVILDMSAVNLEGNVARSKETQQRKLHGRGNVEVVELATRTDVVPAVLVRLVDEVFAICSATARHVCGQEVASSSAQDQIDVSAQRSVSNELIGDLILHSTRSDVRSETGRRGIGDAGSDDKTGGISSPLGRLHDTAAWRVVRRNRDGTIVTLLSTAEGGGPGSAVGDKTVAATRAAVADDVFVQNKRVVDGQSVDVLSPAARQAQRGRAHAIADHEDEVPLSGRPFAMARRGGFGALVLVDDGEDDDGGGSDQGPGEEGNLSPAGPAPAGLLSTRSLTRQEGVFFGCSLIVVRRRAASQ